MLIIPDEIQLSLYKVLHQHLNDSMIPAMNYAYDFTLKCLIKIGRIFGFGDVQVFGEFPVCRGIKYSDVSIFPFIYQGTFQIEYSPGINTQTGYKCG